MRKRSLLANKKGKPIETATYADICFYDKNNDSKIIVSHEEFDPLAYPLSDYTPIGVVAIPSSHTDDNRPRIVSLVEMSKTNPYSGTTINHGADVNIYWGGYSYTVTDLPFKEQFPYLSNLSEDGRVYYDTYDCSLPSDAWSGRTKNPLNSLEGFYSDYSDSMCSPYKEDGSKELRYFDSSSSGNVLSDFDGKSNTEKILSVDNSYSTDWQDEDFLSNEAEKRYVHPAAQVSYLFHTDGTNKGDWYLPSCGELGYAIARQKAIENTFSVINEGYGTTLACAFGGGSSGGHNTSTQYNNDYYIEMYFYDGWIHHQIKNSPRGVRAFLIV